MARNAINISSKRLTDVQQMATISIRLSQTENFFAFIFTIFVRCIQWHDKTRLALAQ